MGFGISSVVSRVVTEYRSDTKNAEAGNKRMDKSFAKVAAAAGAATAAYALLDKGLETLSKNSRLRSATVGVDLEGLREATRGLVADTELLEFASKSMNGTFRLSQAEMESTLRGAIALRNQGKDLADVMERIGQATSEGTTEPLKVLGEVIKGPENDTQEGLEAAVKRLGNLGQEMGDKFGSASDGIDRAVVSAKNANDELSESFGEVAVALGPVIEAVAKLTEGLARLIDANIQLSSGGFLAVAADAIQAEQARRNANRAQFRREQRLTQERRAREQTAGENRQRQLERAGVLLPGSGAGLGLGLGLGASGAAGTAGDVDRAGTRLRRRAGGARELTEGGDSLFAPGGLNVTGLVSGALGAGAGVGDEFLAENELRRQEASAAALTANEEMERSLGKQADEAERLAAVTKGEQGLIASVLGTPAEIDAQAEALNALAKTFDGFAGAFGAGVGALIDGSKSFSDAFQDALASSLKSMAQEMAVRALREGAFALASLAIGDFRGAGQHGLAAAAFAGGAVAAGVSSSLLGGGSATPSAAAGAGSVGVGTASDPGQIDGKSTQLVILSSDFGRLNPRERQARVREEMRGAGFTLETDVITNG